MATLANIVRTYVTSVGTGNLSLGGAVPGFLTPAQAGLPNGASVSYAIIDGVNTEVGRGTYNSGSQSVTRAPLFSTNNNGLINVTATAEFVITFLNEDKTDLEADIAGRIKNVANVVTNSRLAQMTASTFKARQAATLGDPQDVSVADARTMLGMGWASGNGYHRITLGNMVVILGSVVLTTDASGQGVVTYPVTFPGPPYVIFQVGDSNAGGGNAVLTQRADSLQNTGGFIFVARNPAAGVVANSTMRINYFAFSVFN